MAIGMEMEMKMEKRQQLLVALRSFQASRPTGGQEEEEMEISSVAPIAITYCPNHHWPAARHLNEPEMIASRWFLRAGCCCLGTSQLEADGHEDINSS